MKVISKILCIILVFLSSISVSLLSKNYNSLIVKISIKSENNKSYIQDILSKNNFSQSIKYDFSRLKNKLKQNQSLENVENINTAIDNLEKYYTISNDNFQKAQNNAEFIQIKKTLIEIEEISPNYIYKTDAINDYNDPDYPKQWEMKQVNALKAWQKATGRNIIIGLVDTGIDIDHDDLKNQLWINSPEDINKNGKFDPWSSDSTINGIKGDFNGIDEDQNGFVDDIIGYDFVDQSIFNVGDYAGPDPLPYDEGQHGTQVAGVMLAEANNTKGIVGLAYNAKVMTARCFDITGNGESDDISNAIIYTAVNGARVLNFSFGDTYKSPIMESAVKLAYYLNCVMVASSGNDGWYYTHFPSDYLEVISVGGTAINETKYDRGSFGSYLDLVAPAEDVLTTSFGNTYKYSNGTSLAAPFVSAAAAMLLEKNKNLSSENVRGILQSSARDIGKAGWDVYFGSGILDIDAALSMNSIPNFSIIYPNTNQSINFEQNKDVKIKVKCVHPLLDSFKIQFAYGSLPDNFYEIANGNYSFSDNRTFTIPQELLKDTTCTISLKIQLKNKQVIEKRVVFNLISNSKRLMFQSVKAIPAYFEGRRCILLGVETNQASKVSAELMNNSGISIDKQYYFEIENNFHLIKFDYPSTNDNLFKIKINAQNDESNISTNIDFANSYSNSDVLARGFNPKSYHLPFSYLNNNVTDIYSNGNNAIALNILNGLAIADTKTYEFQNNKFILKDSSKEGKIPVGFANSNSNNQKEIFCKDYYQSTLYEFSNDKKIFDNVIYESARKDNLWAANTYDFDKDGKSELVGFNDTAIVILKYSIESKNYSTWVQTPKPENVKKMELSTNTNIAIGDFNNNGSPEITFANKYGILYNYEIKDAKATLLNVDSTYIAIGPFYLSSLDFDADGIEEIAILRSSPYPLLASLYEAEDIWWVDILKMENNRFRSIASEHFYGVRAGSDSKLGGSYKNGITSGNIDNQNGDELVVMLNPSIYIFKFDKSKTNSMKSIFNRNDCFSSDAIIFDFDKNGIKEIGYNTFSNVDFYEYDENLNKIDPPYITDAYAYNNYAVINFSSEITTDGKFYLYQINEDFSVKLIDSSISKKFAVDNLDSNTWYSFALTRFDLVDNVYRESDFSQKVDVFTHRPIKAISADFLSAKSVKVRYNGKLSIKNISPGYFKLFTAENKELEISGVINTSDTICLITLKNNEYFENNAKFNLTCKSFRDYYNSPIDENILEITNTIKIDTNSFVMQSLVLGNEHSKIKFSHKLDVESAINENNYKIEPFGTLSDFQINSEDSSVVEFSISEDISAKPKGFTFTITGSNIKSSNNLVLRSDYGNSVDFVISSSELNTAFTFPNPISLKSGDYLTFGGLTYRCEIEIYNQEGNPIKLLKETDGNGGFSWNLIDSFNNKIIPGIYYYKVKTSYFNLAKDSESELKKFMVIP